MLDRLRSKADGTSAQLHLYRADAHHLPFEDGVFDVAVVTFALCTIPDPERALAEAHRVVRTDGVLRFLEHVRSQKNRTAAWQDRAAPLWGRISGGCRLNQPTIEILEATQWEVDDVWRSGRGSVVAGQALRT
jgi:ubiquinone/menaquinone biosynthesis C-methylase UbiE